MRCYRIPILLLPILGLGSAPRSADAHDVHTQLSPAGVSYVSDNLAAHIPSQLDLGELEVGLFDCGAERATITQSNTRVDLDVSSATLRQDGAQLAVDLAFSASMSGELRLYKVLFCTGDMQCTDSATVTDVSATISLGVNSAGELEVTAVDVDVDPADLDITVADCAAGALTTALIDEVKSLGVMLLENAVEKLALTRVAPLVNGVIDGIGNQEASLGQWNVKTAITELDLSSGVRVVGDVDLSSEAPAPSCFSDPGEPQPRSGGRPEIATAGEHLGVALNLGVLDDLLYHVWRGGIRCDGVEASGAELGRGLSGFPADTRWTLRINLAAPLRMDAGDGALALLAPAIELEVIAASASGTRSVELTVAARIDVGIYMDAAALSFAITGVEVTQIAAGDPRRAARDGFDVEQIRQKIAGDILPGFFSGAITRRVNIPLGLGAAGLYAILRDVRATTSHLIAAGDLFFPPANDTTAPESRIISAPTNTVRPEDATIEIGGSDAEVPSELLSYRATASAASTGSVIELETPRLGRVNVGTRGVTDTYVVSVTAVDLAGNADPSPATAIITVDGIRPTVSLDAEVSGGSPRIEYSATDDLTLAGALTARVTIVEITGSGDVEVYDAALAGDRAIDATLAGGRTYRLTLFVSDAAGNVGVASAVLEPGGGGCSIGGAGGSSGAAVVILLALVGLLAPGRSRRRAGALVAFFALSAAACAGEEDTVPEVPACASDLGASMWAEMIHYEHNSTVPMDVALSASTHVDPGLYITGPEIFGKWAELIAAAEHEVNMQFYKWEPATDPTEAILGGIDELVARRRAAGATSAIPVRIVIDTSAIGVAAPITGIHMPIVAEQLAAHDIDPAYVTVEFAVVERNLLDQFGNIHVKSIVVDGRVGMLTGANPEAQHNFDVPWHDIAAVFHGDVARSLLADFDYSWSDAAVWTCGPGETGDCLRPAEVGEHIYAEPRTPFAASAACSVMTLTRAPSSFLNNDIDNPQDQAYLAAFAGAQRVIKIETPNINDDDAKAALIDAVLRGIEVRLITSKGFNELSEQPVGGPNGDNVGDLYRTLALHGVADACQRLQVRWYAHEAGTPIVGNGPYASHVKYASIDDAVVIVGTTNMDTASWNFSHELNLAIDDARVTAAFDAQLFDADWQRAVVVEQCE